MRGMRWKTWATNVFIGFTLFVIFAWSFPTPIRDPATRWFSGYMRWSGLWQNWRMFAPNPVSQDRYLMARITFKDGSKTWWRMQRQSRQSQWDRMFGMRARKWASWVRDDKYKLAWPSTARWIARKHYTNPRNPPVKVEMVRSWKQLPTPPEPGKKRRIFKTGYKRFHVATFEKGELR